MPVQYTVYPELKLIFSSASGCLTAADVRIHAHTLAADARFNASFDHLADFSDVTEWQVASQEMRGLASIAVFSETSRRALVSTTKTSYGMLRMYHGHLSVNSDKVEIFHSRSDALAWLGHSEDLPLEITPPA